MKRNKDHVYEKHLRMAELIRAALMDAFRKGKVFDLRIRHDLIAISKVKMSNDFKMANCYVRLLQFAANNQTDLTYPEELIKALTESKFGLRKWVAQNVALKYTPDIKFIYDHSLDNVHAVNSKLIEISSS